jgi:hypothetical protein
VIETSGPESLYQRKRQSFEKSRASLASRPMTTIDSGSPPSPSTVYSTAV